ncbi:AraC family transcriptional regulator, partial [Bilophila wadsworthia]
MTRAIRVNTGNSWAILRDIILRNTASRSESYITPIKGFEFHRQVSNADPKPHFYEPVIIVVVQGKKLVKIGAEEHHYGENICFVCGVDMPVSSCVMEASKETPYLSMSLKLDTGLIASLASQIPSPSDSTVYRGAGTQEVDPDLLDAFVRLA